MEWGTGSGDAAVISASAAEPVICRRAFPSGPPPFEDGTSLAQGTGGLAAANSAAKNEGSRWVQPQGAATL